MSSEGLEYVQCPKCKGCGFIHAKDKIDDLARLRAEAERLREERDTAWAELRGIRGLQPNRPDRQA